MKLALALLFVGAVFSAPHSKIESRLSGTLSTKGSANVLVSMRDGTFTVLNSLKTRTYINRADRLTSVAQALRSQASISQKSAAKVLTEKNVEYEVFWITNQIYIRGADQSVVNALAALEEVSEITEEFEVKIEPVIVGKPAPRGILAEWGIENIEAPAAWNMTGGTRGEGAIVGGIDTGVHATHIDLADNFVGTNYGWRDVTLFGTQTPRDGNGHGTHTMGSIVGANGIGVAPGAKWMACKALNDQGSGTNAGLISCGQFMACPTLPNGQSPDCTKAPHVINNSWGGGQANPFYNEVINAWHAAGIVPVFANGNSGPACSTANSPADSLAGVIGVGATTSTNSLAEFSSKGPTLGGRQKPDISAPGQSVRSAWHTPGTNAYNTISGTSMAAPHVAGVVALLKSAKPELTYDQVVAALEQNASHEITTTGMNCGSVSEDTFPNYAFGHGIVNARRALSAVVNGKV